MYGTHSSDSNSPDAGIPSTSSPEGKKHHTAGAAGGPPQRIRRRNRLITSCLECRRRKLKCDKGHPCSNCTRFARDCVFLAPALDPQAQLKLAEIKEKMGSLERTLEEDVARKQYKSGGRSKSRDSLPGLHSDEASEDEETPEDEKDLEPTPFAITDVAYGEDVDDDIVDLGIQMGKMRITERIGGFVRPRMADELKQGLAQLPNCATGQLPPGLMSSMPAFDIAAALRPGSDFVAPSSGFFFAADPRKSTLMHFLPSKTTADRLINQYWHAVHPIARLMHRPTFERKYDGFWKDIAVGIEPKPSFQALLLAVMLSAAVSLPDESVIEDYGVSKAEFVDNFRQGAEAALSRANFLRTTKLETIQALVMYLIPLCRREISRAHTALVSTVVRLAECMGLHRDGSSYGLPAVEVHVRRLVWYQLCFLDIRTCESTGPRPLIRSEDFDTKLPLNVNDEDLEMPIPPTRDSDRFTDMTISRIRFECNEMHRLIWFERPRIERKKTSLTSLLGKVEKFRSAMEKMYYPMLDTKIPLQYFATQVYSILTLRMHTMILHRYASNATRAMPDRLRNMMVSSGTLCMEHAMNVETNPMLKPWSWIAGALQQYHFALLLLGEMYAKPPDSASEARIWRVLDYAFELPAHLKPLQKSRLVLTEMAMKSEAYQKLRRMKAPMALKGVDEKDRSQKQVWNFNENYKREYIMKGGLNYADQRDNSLSPGSTSLSQGAADPSSAPGMPQGYSPQSMPPQPQTGSSPESYSMPGQTRSSTVSSNITPKTIYGVGVFPGGMSEGMNMVPQGMPAQSLPPGLQGMTASSMGMAPLETIHRGSDASSAHFTRNPSTASGLSPPDAGEMMLDIDWNEWDKLFPPDANNPTDNLSIPPFNFPEYAGTVNW